MKTEEWLAVVVGAVVAWFLFLKPGAALQEQTVTINGGGVWTEFTVNVNDPRKIQELPLWGQSWFDAVYHYEGTQWSVVPYSDYLIKGMTYYILKTTSGDFTFTLREG